jgi:hypothetical protein
MLGEMDRLRDVAGRLVRLMGENEKVTALAVEIELFPHGAPASLSIAAFVRAQAAALMRSAEDLARADVAYQETLQKHADGPRGPQRDSLLSQDVATKVARSAEFERAIDEYADTIGSSMEEKFFPEGVPAPLTVQHLVAAVRERLEDALKQAEQDREADLEAATTVLDKEVRIAASFFAGFAGIGCLNDLSAEIASIAGLDELPAG